MIPDHKRTELLELGFDVDELEEEMLKGKEQAEAEGRESKEVQTKDVEPDTQTTEPVAETSEPAPAPVAALDPAQIALAIGTTIRDVLAPVLNRLETLEGQIKELSVQEAATKEAIELTPAASFAAHMRSAIIGQDTARLDGRGSEAKDKPRETGDYSAGGPILASANPLANNTINQLLDPESKWLNELPASPTGR